MVNVWAIVPSEEVHFTTFLEIPTDTSPGGDPKAFLTLAVNELVNFVKLKDQVKFAKQS